MQIAVSACLLGEPIRYDKSGQRDKFITDKLRNYMSFIPFCPEHLAFGTPRQTIRIVLEEQKKRVYTVFSHEEVTQKIHDAMNVELAKITTHEICGIILKSKSPSCGLGSTKYYTKEMGEGKKDGLFALRCKEYFQDFPIEEESRLLDSWLRENFVMQLFAYYDTMQLEKSITKVSELIAFHTSYKFLLQSKHEKNYRLLGNIVANHAQLAFTNVIRDYLALFRKTIAIKSKISKTVNVLEHMAGFLKDELSPIEKKELHNHIKEFQEETIPLIAVMNTIEFLAKQHNIHYLLEQKFLNPYPKSLALRSSIQEGK